MLSSGNPVYEESILHSLRRISRAIDLYSRHLAARCNLTTPQLICLRHIASGPSSPGMIASAVALSPPTVTGILDRLEARSLVVRSRHPQDGRRLVVELTEQGRKLLAEAPRPLQERFAQSLARLSQEEQQAMDETLKKMVAMMEAEAES
jgi:DNA-binding MarR family transcriptional regulator